MFKSGRITIRVESLEESVKFYRDRLGFRETGHFGTRICELTGPDCAVFLVQKLASQPSVAGALAPVSLGLFVDDIDAARTELESRGIVFEGETVDLEAFRIAFMSDPDGTALYVAEMGGLAAWADED